VVVLLFVYMAHRGAKDRSSTRSVQGQMPVKGTYVFLPPHALFCIDLKEVSVHVKHLMS
jgi:hypothetical protein